MTIPLPHISDQTTNDAWSYRATLQINQDTNRIDNLFNRIDNIDLSGIATNTTGVANNATAINNLRTQLASITTVPGGFTTLSSVAMPIVADQLVYNFNNAVVGLTDSNHLVFVNGMKLILDERTDAMRMMQGSDDLVDYSYVSTTTNTTLTLISTNEIIRPLAGQMLEIIKFE